MSQYEEIFEATNNFEEKVIIPRKTEEIKVIPSLEDNKNNKKKNHKNAKKETVVVETEGEKKETVVVETQGEKKETASLFLKIYKKIKMLVPFL